MANGGLAKEMVPRERLELPTCGLGNRCSVLLSYRGAGGGLSEAVLSVNALAIAA